MKQHPVCQLCHYILTFIKTVRYFSNSLFIWWILLHHQSICYKCLLINFVETTGSCLYRAGHTFYMCIHVYQYKGNQYCFRAYLLFCQNNPPKKIADKIAVHAIFVQPKPTCYGNENTVCVLLVITSFIN